MRFCTFSSCLLLCLTTSHSAQSQTSTPSSFQAQAQAAVSAGKPFSVVNLAATAEWTAGSTHESGTAQLQAKADGSASLQFSIGPASRTEVQTKTDSSKICTWIDAAGTSHNIIGPNCFISIPWFAPSLFTQSLLVLPPLLGTTDVGDVVKDNATFHQINCRRNLQSASSPSASPATSLSIVNVYYDPQTYLPARLEYLIHPDNDNLQNIPVRVVFSNYQTVSGVMLPFHVEKYINRTLQLALDVTNASIE
jgi:hypothetical protein